METSVLWFFLLPKGTTSMFFSKGVAFFSMEVRKGNESNAMIMAYSFNGTFYVVTSDPGLRGHFSHHHKWPFVLRRDEDGQHEFWILETDKSDIFSVIETIEQGYCTIVKDHTDAETIALLSNRPCPTFECDFAHLLPIDSVNMEKENEETEFDPILQGV